MKKSELIKLLKNYPDDFNIFVCDYGTCLSITDVRFGEGHILLFKKDVTRRA